MKLSNLYLFEAFSPEEIDKMLQDGIAEWKELKKNLMLVEEIAGIIKSRVADVENEMNQVMADSGDTKKPVDTAILTIGSRKTTSVKYKEAFEKALEVSNAKTKAYLEEFVKSVTSETTKSVFAIKDASLAHVLSDFERAKPEDLLKMVKKLKTLPAKKKIDETITQSIKEIFQKLIAKFSALFKRGEQMVSAAGKLEKISKLSM